jgi:hypothetical protein
LQRTVEQEQKDSHAATAKLKEAVTRQLNAQAAQIQTVIESTIDKPTCFNGPTIQRQEGDADDATFPVA